MGVIDKTRFDHWGIPTHEPKAGEKWLEPSRVWITNPRRHPAHVEFLRYAADSPVSEFRRTNPHIAFRVADVEQAIQGHKVLAGPNTVGNGFARIAFVEIDGAVVELLQWPSLDYEGWFPET
ncbi:MAG TPA: hypothetical protein VJT32_16700 [bacterium]|nr:hypothetical protein [bacterium]